ncbi:hypothetical protein [Actinoalloteichus caeruleus]|uniref:Uncharacterized protein n=1 Tax=Actinoalloteichus caeruleus DSM 43889 TaxID=1120930 RepID=A0ABT1JNZ4_ACTCY|nr:hypothetical protein [Actinoalloteichus caeruleus]MCP2333401.1 hypothetical protein [Actinoalloteichus caeruleus DSM 43889]
MADQHRPDEPSGELVPRTPPPSPAPRAPGQGAEPGPPERTRPLPEAAPANPTPGAELSHDERQRYEQFQQFQDFQRFQEHQRAQRDADPGGPWPPWLKRFLRRRWVRRIALLLLVLFLLSLARDHFFGTGGDQYGGESPGLGARRPVFSSNPSESVIGVYSRIAAPEAEQQRSACTLFTEEAAAQFARNNDAEDCQHAAVALAATVTTPIAYADPTQASPAVAADINGVDGSSTEVSSCDDLDVRGGPPLGVFELELRDDGGWVIAGHRDEDSCSPPAAPPSGSPAPSADGAPPATVDGQGPEATVRELYALVAENRSREACQLLVGRANDAFRANHRTMYCHLAVEGLAGQVTDPDAYSDPGFPDEYREPPAGGGTTISSCRLEVVGGPRLGALDLEQRSDGRWLVVDHHAETC